MEEKSRKTPPQLWLTAASAIFGLCIATVLYLESGDPGWALMVLATSNALAIALSASRLRSAPSEAAEQEHPAPNELHSDAEATAGLPVHPVSGLYRWWVFRQRLEGEIERAARHERNLSLVMLEPADLLDEPPDETRAAAAKTLRRVLRGSDFAAQYDDERFIVLLPETDATGARVAARRLIAGLYSSGVPPVLWRGSLVTYPEDGADPDVLTDRALTPLRLQRLEGAVAGFSTDEGEADPKSAA